MKALISYASFKRYDNDYNEREGVCERLESINSLDDLRALIEKEVSVIVTLSANFGVESREGVDLYVHVYDDYVE